MLRTAILLLAIVTIEPGLFAADGWLTVGAPGNMPDITGHGAVAYEFQIQRCEVTVREYAEFLNCVATQADPYQLWVPAMGEHVITDLGQGGIRKDVPQCILRVRANGEWSYEPVVERLDCPVFLVSFFSALRYANWLHNGKRQNQTETGAYDLSTGVRVERSANAEVWLPSEDDRLVRSQVRSCRTRHVSREASVESHPWVPIPTREVRGVPATWEAMFGSGPRRWSLIPSEFCVAARRLTK